MFQPYGSHRGSSAEAKLLSAGWTLRWLEAALRLDGKRPATWTDVHPKSVCFNRGAMPKMKTHSGSKKRFRKTAKGKLRGRRANASHILEKKSPARKRRLGRPSEISRADRRRVTALLAWKGR